MHFLEAAIAVLLLIASSDCFLLGGPARAMTPLQAARELGAAPVSRYRQHQYNSLRGHTLQEISGKRSKVLFGVGLDRETVVRRGRVSESAMGGLLEGILSGAKHVLAGLERDASAYSMMKVRPAAGCFCM